MSMTILEVVSIINITHKNQGGSRDYSSQKTWIDHECPDFETSPWNDRPVLMV